MLVGRSHALRFGAVEKKAVHRFGERARVGGDDQAIDSVIDQFQNSTRICGRQYGLARMRSFK